LDYPGPLEILVVDDQSQDDTPQVAARWGVPTLSLDSLPAGWLGKPYAAHRGAQATRGEWLLFTDADTWHAPHSAASAVAWAQAQGADGLTLFPAFEGSGVLEAAVWSVAFASLFAALPSLGGLVNGQYLLVRREAYEGAGGFAAVRDQMLEDLAFGRRLQACGYRILLAEGQDAVRVRAYARPGRLLDGMSRLSAGAVAALGGRWWIPALLVATMVCLGWVSRRGRLAPWQEGLIRWAAGGLAMLPWASRMGRPESSLLAPVGAAFLALAGLRGGLHRWMGKGIPWKGRRVR
jgi:cellulose synthase/poly-beta-1,6-N-acetylglucosamine synthase-like glycosyltransferase